MSKLPLFGAVIGLGLLALPGVANAEGGPEVERRGGQWSVLVGGSACVPGHAPCRRESTVNGITLDGSTRPSLAAGGELGYRFNPYVFAGASYRFGMFDMSFVDVSGAPYEVGYQHSIYGVVRPTLPLWRFDLGLTLGPGYSRQVFRLPHGDRDYGSGFSWMFGPTVDVFLAKRIFLGVRADLLLNGQGKLCQQRVGTTTCAKATTNDAGPVHQVVFGLHVGGTFL